MRLALQTAALTILSLCWQLRAAATTEQDEFFEVRIRPVLMGTCFKCHGGEKTSNGLRVDGRAHLRQGGERGPALVPGDAKASLLLRAIGYQDSDLRMPPKEQLPPDVVADLEKWIADGAHWPENAAAAKPGAGRHWAFLPLSDPKPGNLRSSSAPHPIDLFISATQQRQGIEPVALADRRTLIRRAAFDLTGLPPDPAQVAAFLSDSNSDAFARVIDQLLGSPRYGERWGRHWLDLVRYADTAGDDSDYPIPQAALYRDYVIEAFNTDKPYDVFLEEQLAGDILARQTPMDRFEERIIATGYIAQAKRFATLNREDMHLIIEDTLHTTGQAMLGLTLRCARCHDHKYDPTTMEDYYALYGIFRSTVYPHPGSEEDRRPGDLISLVPDAELAKRNAEFDAEHGGRIQALESQIKQLELEDTEESRKQTKPLRKELNDLRLLSPSETSPKAYAVKDGDPVDTEIQVGGDPHRKDRRVPRGVPRFLPSGGPLQIPDGRSGRLELAKWLTHPDNPLTARVMVNRIWQHHFGKGLVPTPSNFGLAGEPPSHPDLLDWLACRFIESGWSIKTMHRLIMLSDTWQRASLHGEHQKDPANITYWRFDRRRLEAESIRDTLLLVCNNLDLTRPAPHPFPTVATWRFSAHHQFKGVYPSQHRSVYLMVQRLHPHPYLSLFNGPDTTASTAVRDSSTLPLQALFLANSPFIHHQADGFAQRLASSCSDTADRVNLAYQLLFSRPPTPAEQNRAQEYLRKYAGAIAQENTGADHPEAEAWASLSRILFASNEFVYID